VRDVASLAGLEMLPWDGWGLMPKPDETPAGDLAAELDAAARLTLEPDAHFDALRALYEQPQWRVPPEVFNAVTGRMDAV